MSDASQEKPRLEPAGNGRFVLAGPVSFATAGALLETGNAVLADAPSAEIDLSGVTRIDSAGLALLIEWLRLADLSGRSLRLSEMPDRLRAIARLTGVDEILDGV